MTNRIMGSETEWAMLLTENGEYNPSVFFESGTPSCGILFRSIPSPPRLDSSLYTESQFYGNGSRIYIDTGNHCEYATGEVMGAYELVQHEKAGERVIECAVANANRHHEFKEHNRNLRAFKNNKDAFGSSFGLHENYCMLREKCHDFLPLFQLLGPHRIGCKLFAGNGWLKDNKGSLAYHLSQRAEEMKEGTGNSTTTGRSIVNRRDEPHAEERYFRLHLIDGDALMAEPATFLKVGTTSLVLDMIESGFLRGKPFGNGDDFVKALHAFSEDATLRVAPNIGGKTYTIINVQEEYFNWGSQFCKTSGSTPVQQLVLQWWEKFLTLAKTPEPHIALAKFVDWAAKKLLMERKLEKLGYGWSTASTTELPKKITDRSADDEEVILLPEQIAAQGKKNPPTLFYLLKSMDFQFHENSPRGLARILEKRGFLERIVADKEIQHAMTHPSKNTRALPRTLWNKKLLKTGAHPSLISVNWQSVAYGRNVLFKCPDPYDTDPRF